MHCAVTLKKIWRKSHPGSLTQYHSIYTENVKSANRTEVKLKTISSYICTKEYNVKCQLAGQQLTNLEWKGPGPSVYQRLPPLTPKHTPSLHCNTKRKYSTAGFCTIVKLAMLRRVSDGGREESLLTIPMIKRLLLYLYKNTNTQIY